MDSKLFQKQAIRSKINQNSNLIFSNNENDCVQFEILTGRYCKILLNQQKNLNSLDEDVINKIRDVLQLAERNSCLFFMLEGNGKSFCSGEDLNMKIQAIKNNNYQQLINTNFNEIMLYYEISQLQIPQISIWDGIVMGGGVTISIFGIYRIATENTIFSIPECQLGYFPCGGAMYFLSHLRQTKFGLYLGLSGARLKGYDVLLAGLATHYIESQNLPIIRIKLMEAKSEQEIQEILRCSSVTLFNRKLSNIDEITQNFSEYSLVKTYQQLQKNSTTSQFCKELVDKLNQFSPFGLLVWYRLFQLGKSKSKDDLREIFSLEFNLIQKMIGQSDYLEVMKSLFLKDDLPKWKFKGIYHISDLEIYEFIFKNKNGIKSLF